MGGLFDIVQLYVSNKKNMHGFFLVFRRFIYSLDGLAQKPRLLLEVFVWGRRARAQSSSMEVKLGAGARFEALVIYVLTQMAVYTY